ncbi:hypothetical protein G3570_11875 [Balneolaceae bacterium YR4-1]|uniref:SGNH/GDSL hydrolase family protein n=1 Tax=Halalkalibaculum roseum TaxID=2709311 RepID=A0A6M1T3L9_9BACT|nr:DUF4886 domain-containing protein [Halalkalibaculum roseum]NGP77337.1 hypothetical protein [Halalkalibaculum roseum]
MILNKKFRLHRIDGVAVKIMQSLLILLFISYNANAQHQPQIPEKVLFVGNSYIYFWNLPQQVSALAKSQNVELNAAQSTSGGTNWGQHWRGEKGIRSKELIKDGDFDAVVLQNHSRRSLDAPDSLMYYGKKFADLISENDGRTYLYMTWAREWNPYMQEAVTEAYKKLAEDTRATVVPVGLAWERARELRPDINLYAEDGSHPSPLGSYLTACVFYKVFTGSSIKNLPARLLSKDYSGEKLYLNILSEENAAFLQQVAEEVVNLFIHGK